MDVQPQADSAELRLPWTNGVFVVWKSECYRSGNTAEAFQLDLIRIAPFRGDKAIDKLLRYVCSVPLTLSTLVRRRPDIIFALNQPMPLLACVYLYARLFSIPYVLDSHSTPFKAARGSLRYKFYSYFAKNALFNINHNRMDAEKVKAMPARSYLIPEIATEVVQTSSKVALRAPNVLVVCSFLWDEPLDVIFAAAEMTPDVTFYLTGNWRRRASDVEGKVLKNIVLLGFIPRDDYLEYLTRCGAVLTLSTRSHIMQMAAEEALSAATPLITNESPILEEVFGDSAVYARLEARSVHDAIRTVIGDNATYRDRMLRTRRKRQAVLNRTIQVISNEVQTLRFGFPR